MLFWLFASPLLVNAQSSKDQLVLDTEQRRFEAMTARDTTALKNLLHADLYYLHSNAMLENKNQHLASIGTGRLVYQKMKRESVKVRRYGQIAITNGVLAVSGLNNGNSFDLKLLYTAVYKREHKTWRLLNWQSTRSAP